MSLLAASASGAVVTTSLQLAFSQTVQAPISSTQFETVTLAGRLHLVTQVTQPADPCPPGNPCQVPVTVHLNLVGVSGVGQITGQTYNATGVSQSSGTATLPGGFFLQGGFRLIPPNPAIPPNPIKVLVFVNVSAQGTATSASTTPPGLVSWWKGEGDALDAMGANPGTLNGVVGFVQGRVGQAFDFRFTETPPGYVQVLNSASLQPGAVTVAAWVNHAGNPGGNKYIVSKGAKGCEAASYALYSGEPGLNLRFYVFDGSTFVESPDGGAGVWDGNWHFVVGTYDGAAVRLYVDGVEVGSGTPTSIPINYFLPDDSNFYIGAYRSPACNLAFLGGIDEVQLYSRALSAAEIQALYLSTP